MGSDVKASLERFYVSTSMLEIRMSELTHGTDRLPYITILYMDLIGFNPGITSSQIAEMLGVTKATVTSTVNRLVEKGYVVRERSEDDGRVRNLRLSDRTMEDYRMESRLFGRASAMLCDRYTPEEVYPQLEALGVPRRLYDPKVNKYNGSRRGTFNLRGR